MKEPLRRCPAGPERIGLFGGTFDPIHLGHLRAAEEIRQLLSLSRVEFVPARIPPHKTGQPLTAIAHRLAMVRRATRGNPFFRASDVEARRQGVSYLVDTLGLYRRKHGPTAALYFIMGMDSFQEIATWHRYPELFCLSDFVVITRPGYSRPRLSEVVSAEVAASFVECRGDPDCLEHESGHRILFLETTLMDISASKVRDWIRTNRSARYLVPDPVWRYIQEKQLYIHTERR